MADNNFKNQSDYSLKKMTAEIYEALFFGKRRNYRKAERLFNALCKADTEKKYLTPEIEEKFRNEIKFQKTEQKNSDAQPLQKYPRLPLSSWLRFIQSSVRSFRSSFRKALTFFRYISRLTPCITL